MVRLWFGSAPGCRSESVHCATGETYCRGIDLIDERGPAIPTYATPSPIRPACVAVLPSRRFLGWAVCCCHCHGHCHYHYHCHWCDPIYSELRTVRTWRMKYSERIA